MFVFYDFETTGTSPAFDQPVQFAAILTDHEFNQVERVDIRCRLSPHILPAPCQHQQEAPTASYLPIFTAEAADQASKPCLV